MLANHVFLAINALLHSLAAVAATFSAVAFYQLPLIIMQSHRQSEFRANLMYHESDPGQAGYPTLKRSHGKIWPRLRGLPGLAVQAPALAGHPTYHANVIK